MVIPELTQSEIAWVTRRLQCADDTAQAHQSDRYGFCLYCKDKLWPCNPWLVADHARTWARGRLDEIDRRLNGSALAGPTMFLSTVDSGSGH